MSLISHVYIHIYVCVFEPLPKPLRKQSKYLNIGDKIVAP